jgi:hypothetical protein
MKQRGRVLHFAVTGVLLGGVGIGCAAKGPHTNTRHVEEEEVHANPGPNQPPDADGGAADGGAAPDEPVPDAVNEAPVDEPEPADVNPGPQ